MKPLSRSVTKEVPVSLSCAVLAHIREFRKQLQNFSGPKKQHLLGLARRPLSRQLSLSILATPGRAESGKAGSRLLAIRTLPVLPPGPWGGEVRQR